MPPNAIELPPEAAAALRRGQMIPAIKLLRQATGMSLKEAKDAVEVAAREHAQFSQLLNDTDQEFFNSTGLAFPPDASAAMEQGNFIEAIALLREANPQLDFVTAEALVDDYLHPSSTFTPTSPSPKQNAQAPRERVPTVVRGDGNRSVWLLALVIIVLGASLMWGLVGNA